MKNRPLATARHARKSRSGAIVSLEKQMLRIDHSDLKADYDSWPSLGHKSWSETDVPILQRSYERVALVGMGGSLLTGELIVDLAREKRSKICFETVKDYHLPSHYDENTLVIGMSSSGNTEETLSALSEAHSRDLNGITLGSGGAIESLSKTKWNFHFIRTTMLKVPRSSLPGIFYPVIKLLVRNQLLEVNEEEIKESIHALGLTKTKSISNDEKGNYSLKLAKHLNASRAMPLLYSSDRTRAVGLRARQSINENSKMHAFNGEIPELCHNEIVGWDFDSTVSKGFVRPRSVAPESLILLRLREDDSPEVNARFDAVEEIARKNRGNVFEIPHLGKSYLARIISMLYLLDCATYYLAILRGVDPIATPSITFLKKRLAAKLDFVSRL